MAPLQKRGHRDNQVDARHGDGERMNVNAENILFDIGQQKAGLAVLALCLYASENLNKEIARPTAKINYGFIRRAVITDGVEGFAH